MVPPATAPADGLWRLLNSVQVVRFTARSGGRTGWDGEGAGTVAVEVPSAAVLIYREAGTWRTPAGRESRFHNAYRWTRFHDTAVRLEHLRFGDDQPVHLFDLTPDADGGWASAGPHVCAEDCYTAELRPVGDGFTLDWAVTGPRKNERIEYRYGPA